MNRLTIVLFLALVVSCSPKIISTTDTKVEYKEITTYRDSIVYYKVVDSVVVNKTKDTVSVIETDMARSIASVNDGVLYHELRNKAGLRAVNVSIPRTLAQEIRTNTITRTIEVPAQLTKWQNLRILLGDILMGAVIAFIIYIIVKILVRR